MVETSRTTAEIADGLESILREQLETHERWSAVLADHRAGIAAADPKAIAAATEAQAALMQRVDGLERRRLELLGSAGNGQTITATITTLPASRRAVLTELAQKLRTKATEIRGEQQLIRAASENLMVHMRGLMSQIAARLSHAGTYGAGGRVESAATVVSGLDVSR